jgi:ABC-type glutathione transport system ATPase component
MSRLVVLHKGKFLYDGKPADVFANDLGQIGVFVPPLVRFSQAFGFPYLGSIEDIKTGHCWSAAIKADPAPAGDLIASLKDVRYRYPGTKTEVLKGVSIDFHRGEIVAIM